VSQARAGNTSDSLFVVIPVYNEGDNILSTLAELEEKLPMPATVYIVYDFEQDTTLAALPRHPAQRLRLEPIRNRYGRGALNAIKSGFAAVPEGLILVAMADLSDDFCAVSAMLEKVRSGADVVCGSRYMRGGRQIGGPLLKRTFSRLAGLSLHWLTGLPTHDPSNSFKLYRKQVLDAITIESDGGFELGMEIVVKAWAAGFTITEVPSIWRDRSAGSSRFRMWQWIPKYVRWYFHALGHRLQHGAGKVNNRHPDNS